MEGRVYPKPIPSPPQLLNGAATDSVGEAGGQPSTKALMRGIMSPAYRRPLHPPPPCARPRRSTRRVRRRNCCGACCLWLSLVLIALFFLSAIASGVFYVLYHPRLPELSVSSLSLSALELTDSNFLTARLDITITASNPNKKLVFFYGPTIVSASSNGVMIGEGEFSAFVHGTENTTTLRTTISSSRWSLVTEAAAELRRESRLPLDIEMVTSVGVELAGLKTKRIGARGVCNGIQAVKPNQKAAGSASPSTLDAACKVKLYVEAWEWAL